MKKFDPYYIKDPTKPHAPVAQTGRASDGRFTAKLETNTMTDENFPVDSRWWSRYALGTRQRVHSMRPHLPGLIFPDPEGETIFSWRMICEMYEAARDALLAGKSDEEAIAAAHAHLAAKQAELPAGDYDSPAPQDAATSNRISTMIRNQWNSIPEMPL